MLLSTLQDSLSVNSELSKSNDSLTDSSTKVMLIKMSVNYLCRFIFFTIYHIFLFQEKGGAFIGMFKKTTKAAKEGQSQVCRRKKDILHQRQIWISCIYRPKKYNDKTLISFFCFFFIQDFLSSQNPEQSVSSDSLTDNKSSKVSLLSAVENLFLFPHVSHSSVFSLWNKTLCSTFPSRKNLGCWVGYWKDLLNQDMPGGPHRWNTIFFYMSETSYPQSTTIVLVWRATFFFFRICWTVTWPPVTAVCLKTPQLKWV